MNEMRNIQLPEELCRRAEEKFRHRFGSLHDLLASTLNELLRDDVIAMDEQETKIIEERLKGLGYI